MKYLQNILTAVVAISILTASSCSGPEPDTKAPPTPVGLITNAGDGSVTVTWIAVTAGDLAGYFVYHQDAAGGSEEKSTLLNLTTFTVTGLVNGTSYRFTVTSVDEAGNESVHSSEVTATPNNEVSLTSAGWEAWEAQEYETASASFQSALSHNQDYTEAYTGLGWTALRQGDVTTAASRFHQAIQKEPANEDPRVGGLIVNRELPGGLPIAMIYGKTALENDPDYLFSHDPSIDTELVQFMLAQVYFLNGEFLFPDAQELLDVLVTGNGLDPSSSSSWIVDGTTYSSYPAALLALLEFAFTLVGG
ncbi:fibronectin type III domain-containing protein [Candidatus Zixiibacteriota bacterium]